MEATRKLLGAISTYSKSVGYKINIKSSFIILAVNYQREIRKNISLIIAFKKYLIINLPKEGKELLREGGSTLFIHPEPRGRHLIDLLLQFALWEHVVYNTILILCQPRAFYVEGWFKAWNILDGGLVSSLWIYF